MEVQPEFDITYRPGLGEDAHNRVAFRRESDNQKYYLHLSGPRVHLAHVKSYDEVSIVFSHIYQNVQTARLAFDHCAKLLEQGLIEEMKPRYHRPIEEWDVWSLDVWGNARDGYEVNDRSRSGFIELPADPSDQEIVQALKHNGYLGSKIKLSSIGIDDHSADGVYDINDDRQPRNYSHGWGEPLYTLEKRI